MTIKETENNIWEIDFDRTIIKVDLYRQKVSVHKLEEPWKVNGKINLWRDSVPTFVREWDFSEANTITAEDLLMIILKSYHL